MNAPNPIAQVLTTFARLEKEIVEAQKGPMDPRMRAELARLAGSTRACLTNLGASNQAAEEKLAAKRSHVAAMAAENRQKIAKQKAKLAEKQAKPTPDPIPAAKAPPLDPTLGSRLAAELLARQVAAVAITHSEAKGVLDQWEWQPAVSPSSEPASAIHQ